MKKLQILLCAAALPAILTCCAAKPVPSVTKITSEEAQKMMSGDVIILDVRTQDEYAGGHIPNAICLPVDQVSAQAANVLPDKSQTILVYCRSGVRASTASQTLADMGYTNVYNFGGILSWPGEIIQ